MWGFWSLRDIPPQTGRHVVITVGNSGIGFEVARALLDAGASVTLASRNLELVKRAARDLQEEFPTASVEGNQMDLEDLGSVRAFARDLMASGAPIHLLINMAGRYLDADGFEASRASIYWGHALLTLLLLPRILESGPARIVNMVSVAESFAQPLDWQDLQGDKLGTSGAQAYATAKLMLLLFSQELQRRLRLTGRDVECFAVQPGLVATALGNKISLVHPFSWVSLAAWLPLGQSPVQGATSTLFAATSPDLRGRGGAFIGPQYSTWLFHAVPRYPRNPPAWLTMANADARMRLWDDSLRMLEEKTGERVTGLAGVPHVRDAAPAPSGVAAY